MQGYCRGVRLRRLWNSRLVHKGRHRACHGCGRGLRSSGNGAFHCTPEGPPDCQYTRQRPGISGASYLRGTDRLEDRARAQQFIRLWRLQRHRYFFKKDLYMNEITEMVLTGTGLVSAAGTAKKDFFKYLRRSSTCQEQRNGSKWLEAGQLLKHLEITEPKLKSARYMDPVSKNAIVAVGRAMTDAGLDEFQISADPYEYGIVLGTTRGACVTREAVYGSLASRRNKMMSGTLFSHCGYNIAGAMAAIAYGIKGPNITVASREDLGLCILKRARQILMRGRAHTVFAGFTECDGLSKRGSPLGEIAFVLCLESKARAVARAAVALAEVRVQDGERDDSRSVTGGVYGLQARDPAQTQSAEALSVSLPGLHALSDRYRSLILTAFLSHEPRLKDRFPAVAVASGAGSNGALSQLLYPEEQHAAV